MAITEQRDPRNNNTYGNGYRGQVSPEQRGLTPTAPVWGKTGQAPDPQAQAAMTAANRRAQLDAFINRLNSPLDLNDPFVKQIAQGASNAASDEARRRGVGGSLSVSNVQRSVTNAYTGLDQSRKELGLRAMQEGFKVEDADRMFDENNKRYAANQADAAALQKYKNDQNSGSSLGGIIGGGLGALGGFALGGPAGAATGWNMGAQAGGYVGGGLGGGFSAPPRSSYTPTKSYSEGY